MSIYINSQKLRTAPLASNSISGTSLSSEDSFPNTSQIKLELHMNYHWVPLFPSLSSPSCCSIKKKFRKTAFHCTFSWTGSYQRIVTESTPHQGLLHKTVHEAVSKKEAHKLGNSCSKECTLVTGRTKQQKTIYLHYKEKFQDYKGRWKSRMQNCTDYKLCQMMI